MKHIPHLYLAGDWRESSIVTTEQQNGHLARSLRLTAGAAVTYTNGSGVLGSGIWTGSDVTRGEESVVPRPRKIVLAVSPPASRHRTRFLVEKLAELGVESLVWLRTAWGSGRVPSGSKLAAWASSALEQSRGAWLMSTSGSIVEWADLEAPLVVCSPDGRAPGPSIGPRTVAIGPEGGLSPDEIPKSADRIRLGETILRIETAAITAAVMFS